MSTLYWVCVELVLLTVALFFAIKNSPHPVLMVPALINRACWVIVAVLVLLNFVTVGRVWFESWGIASVCHIIAALIIYYRNLRKHPPQHG